MFITAFYLLVWLFITNFSGMIHVTASWQEYALAVGTILPVVASMYSLRRFLPTDISISRFVIAASVPPALAVAFSVATYEGVFNLTQALSEVFALVVYIAVTYFLLNRFTK